MGPNQFVCALFVTLTFTIFINAAFSVLSGQ
jgi:hypothetical protein